MTHRSRSGGPLKKRGQVKKRGPKIHHPPPLGAAPDTGHEDGEDGEEVIAEDVEEDDAGVPPASHFAQPTNDEVLTVLRWALLDTLNSDEFPALVQRAKGLLFERKWIELFTDPGLLDAYAGRWVPSRALCFRDMMAGIQDVRKVFSPADGERSAPGPAKSASGSRNGETSELDDDEPAAGEDTEEDAEKDGDCAEVEEKDDAEVVHEDDVSHSKVETHRTHILSLGGGAGSELLALAALASRGGRIRWTGVDVGAWGSVISRIEAAARDRWKLDAEIAFVEGDLLAPPSQGLTPEVSPTADSKGEDVPSPMPNPSPTPAFVAIPALAQVPAPDITTLFFTLTELLSQNRARTVALLRAITAATPPGGLLLVADSASDIAEFPLGKDGRTWPVYRGLQKVFVPHALHVARTASRP